MQYSQDLLVAARRRLQELAETEPGFFARMCNAAHGVRNPTDPNGHLCSNRNVVFTDNHDVWLPGYRELVVLLTEPDADDVSYVVVDAPLVAVTLGEAA